MERKSVYIKDDSGRLREAITVSEAARLFYPSSNRVSAIQNIHKKIQRKTIEAQKVKNLWYIFFDSINGYFKEKRAKITSY